MTPRPALVLAPPADRGPLVTAAQVANLIGGVEESWVRRYVPGKLTLGHRTVRWYQGEVETWIASRRGAA